MGDIVGVYCSRSPDTFLDIEAQVTEEPLHVLEVLVEVVWVGISVGVGKDEFCI